jgi:hypothetical protein
MQAHQWTRWGMRTNNRWPTARPGSGVGGVGPYVTLGGSTCSGKLFVADGAGQFNEALNQDLLVSVLVS